jgi:hypothetical protein
MLPSAICRLSVPLAASIFRASIAVGEPITVGAVDKVQAQVEATQAGQTRALIVKSDVYFGEKQGQGTMLFKDGKPRRAAP